jgi:hypothetical protein
MPKKTGKSRTTLKSPLASTENGLPRPFEPAPEQLKPWLSKLSKTGLYLTHIDANPKALKKQVFIVPVILNICFVIGIAWRLMSVYPWYASLVKQVWDLATNATSPKDLYPTGSIFSLIRRELYNSLHVIFDYALLLVVAPWPWSFFLEQPGNPISWRRNIWFRDRELIVRVSRGWDVNDLLHGEKIASASPYFVTRVYPAVQMDRISKTGYLLMDKDWDLDFYAMTEGQKDIDEKIETQSIDENAFNGKMFAFWKPSASSDDIEGKWVMWNYRKDLYEKDSESESAEEKGNATEGKRAVDLFKQKLTEMGKEDLFFEWINLIHFESSKPGGFTKERQIAAGAQVKQLFEKHEVDFEKFEKECGIQDGHLVD